MTVTANATAATVFEIANAPRKKTAVPPLPWNLSASTHCRVLPRKATTATPSQIFCCPADGQGSTSWKHSRFETELECSKPGFLGEQDRSSVPVFSWTEFCFCGGVQKDIDLGKERRCHNVTSPADTGLFHSNAPGHTTRSAHEGQWEGTVTAVQPCAWWNMLLCHNHLVGEGQLQPLPRRVVEPSIQGAPIGDSPNSQAQRLS